MKTKYLFHLSGALVTTGIILGLPRAFAYEDYSGCVSCHGDFRANPYTSKSDNQSWGNSLHNVHRSTMLSSDCGTCHSGGGTDAPVFMNTSDGGSGLAAISCLGCHGRPEPNHANAVSGAGLRQRHWRAGQTVCGGCHADSDPANFVVAAESVKPPYYANPGTGHPNMPTDPCNLDGKENFAGSTAGLDNDGNGIFDAGDCLYPSGDVNADRHVTGADSLLINQVIVGLRSNTHPIFAVAGYQNGDVNQSGGVTGADSLLINQTIVGLRPRIVSRIVPDARTNTVLALVAIHGVGLPTNATPVVTIGPPVNLTLSNVVVVSRELIQAFVPKGGGIGTGIVEVVVAPTNGAISYGRFINR